MGNYVSCTLSTPLIKNAKAARAILPGGEIRQFRGIIKAAELMLECPNFFVVNSTSLHIGRRFSALSADEELELGNVYVMVPMKRVNSVVMAADMAPLFMAANSASKRIAGGGTTRVLPESNVTEKKDQENDDDEDEGSRLSLEEVDDGFMGLEEFKYRFVASRSRKPLLETINEESVCTR